jgi:positive regulator of sigma E activity
VIFHPLVLSLFVASLLISFMILYASAFGAQVLRRWDLRSGSELQLGLERKTYLISTLVTYLFAAELLSLFLYVFTADRIHGFFVGAMCAAGALRVNGFGYPTLLLKGFNGLLAGLWLVLNWADNKGYDYPLIKTKYFWLLAATPPILAETFLQASYFLRLKPDIVTSCCGSLFSLDGGSIASDLASLPQTPMKFTFFAGLVLTLAVGAVFYRTGRGGVFFAASSGLMVIVTVLSIISFISIYVYELPTHHCPFCLLQTGYNSIGYPIYLALFGGGISGLGVGVLTPFRRLASLSAVIPALQRRLAAVALACFFVLGAIIVYAMAVSGLIMPG